jgi:hypothetical protein
VKRSINGEALDHDANTPQINNVHYCSCRSDLRLLLAVKKATFFFFFFFFFFFSGAS